MKKYIVPIVFVLSLCFAVSAFVYADTAPITDPTSPACIAHGDANHDGFVNGADYLILDSKNPWGDVNGDGVIDSQDYAILDANQGLDCSTLVTPPAPTPAVSGEAAPMVGGGGVVPGYIWPSNTTTTVIYTPPATTTIPAQEFYKYDGKGSKG